MSVLVTGGTGLIGKYLQKIRPEWVYLSSKDYNLISQRSASELVAQERPDWIIHLAAKVGGVLDNQKYPCDYYEENMLIGVNLLSAARHAGVKNFTAILSTCAYPDVLPDDRYPLKEEDLHSGIPAESNSGYGIAKRAMATHIDMINKQYGFSYNYLIPCNLYGFYDNYDLNSSHYVAALIKKIYEAKKTGEKKIVLFGTGTPLRQFMYAGDMAEILSGMVENKITSSFNVATPEVKSIKEIAEIALTEIYPGCEIEFDSTKPDGQFRKDVSIERFENIDPFTFTDLAKGIRETFDYYELTQTRLKLEI